MNQPGIRMATPTNIFVIPQAALPAMDRRRLAWGTKWSVFWGSFDRFGACGPLGSFGSFDFGSGAEFLETGIFEV